MLRRIGPSVRTSTARSIARATAGGSGDEDDLAALTAHAQDPVAVFLTEITDVGSAGFEDPQPEQTQYRDEGEVIRLADSRAVVIRDGILAGTGSCSTKIASACAGRDGE